jgi:hypothetical protein
MTPYIPGVYNYCDRWCERCAMQSGCAVYAQTNGLPEPSLPEPQQPPDWLVEALEELNREPTPEELAEMNADAEKRDALTNAHPARQLAHRYSMQVWNITKAQDEKPFHDPVISLAWDSIRTLATCISAKTTRAIHEVIDRQRGDDWHDRALDPRGVQSDGNGSAKITRLMLQESQEAWMAVARFDPLWSRPGVEMAALLEELDREVSSAFPYAMEFVRPGFDD